MTQSEIHYCFHHSTTKGTLISLNRPNLSPTIYIEKDKLMA